MSWVEHEAAGFGTHLAYDESELGEYQYTLRVFENGLMTRVIAEDRGVFVTTDGITVRRAMEVSRAITSIVE
jgi:CRISPR/Cas system-associated protein Cas7 (RAMP superfamily)